MDSGIRVSNLYKGREHRAGIGRIFCVACRDDLQIHAIVPRRSLQLTLLIEHLRKIKLRVGLSRIDVDRALPVVHRLFVMPEAMRQHSIIDQSVGVSWPAGDNLLELRIRIGVVARFNQAASIGLLERRDLRD